MAGTPLISADGHVIEPPDLWTARVGPEFRDLAPHVETDKEGFVRYVVGENVASILVGVAGSTGRMGEAMEDARRMGHDALRPSGWDPDARVLDQDTDGVVAEVVYPTVGRRLFDLENMPLRHACMRAYNDWLADFCGAHPGRLIGVPLIDLEDIEWAIAELNRTRGLGHRVAGVWEAPAEDRPYHHPMYEPFFAAAVDLDVSLSMHIGTSATAAGRAGIAAGIAAAAGLVTNVDVSRRTLAMQHTLQSLTTGGVLERFPTLKWVAAEHNIGWVPYFLQALDQSYERWIKNAAEPLPMLPSAYVRRQVYFTFESDFVGAQSTHLFGADNFLWASDFPHPASTWPHSRKVIEGDFDGVPDDIIRQVVHDNAAKLYGIAV